MTDQITVPRETWDALLEAHRKLIRAYVNLLESGRDRITSLGGTCDPVDQMEAGDPALREAKDALTAANAVSELVGINGFTAAETSASMSAMGLSRPTVQPQYSIDTDPQGIRARVVSAVVGAMAYGASNTNKPPEDHWLNEVWDIARAEANRVQPQATEPLGYKLVPVAENISGERLPRCKKCGDAIFDVSSDACRVCGDSLAPKQAEPQPNEVAVQQYDKAQIEKAVITLVYAATFGSNPKYEDGNQTENRMLQLDCAKYLHSLVSADEFESAYEFTLRQFDAMPPCTRIEGWKLVPIEPTQGMLDMARVALQEAGRTMARHAADKVAYRAMLAAAPEAKQ